MTDNHFKYFAAPDKIIAIDAGPARRFDNLSTLFSSLEVFPWDVDQSDKQNFDALVEFAVERDRNRLLVAGCSVDQSCLIISLLALGRGFDVYVYGDQIDGPDGEKALLLHRLRQHGAIIVSEKQVMAEFSAASQNAH